MNKEEKIRELALQNVCPYNMNPTTQYEKNAVGQLISFGLGILAIPEIAKALEYYRLMHSQGHDVEKFYKE